MCILFSVITTVYNADKYIYNAMQSVASQTEKNFEYIVVNNGSNDNSKELIEEFIKKNSNIKIKLIDLEKNVGISGGRNTGIENASGEYICFLDADDSWLPEKLEKVKEAICNHSENDVFCHWEIHKTEKNEYIAKYRDIDNTKAYLDLLFNGNCLSTSALTVKSTLIKKIGGFSAELVSGEEDFDCWLKMAREGAKFCMIKEPLGIWLIRNDSISAKHIKHTEAIIAMLQPHYDSLYDMELSKRMIEKKRNRNSAMLLCGCGRVVAKDKNIKESNQLYKKAIMYDPKYVKSYLGYILNILKL